MGNAIWNVRSCNNSVYSKTVYKNTAHNSGLFYNHQSNFSLQDFALQAIKLTGPASYFVTDAQLTQTHAIPSKAELGGFLNYDVLYARYDNYNEINGLAELGIFKDYWIFKNAMMYRKEVEQDQDKLLRLNTSFEIEFPSRYQRLTFGW